MVVARKSWPWSARKQYFCPPLLCADQWKAMLLAARSCLFLWLGSHELMPRPRWTLACSFHSTRASLLHHGHWFQWRNQPGDTEWWNQARCCETGPDSHYQAGRCSLLAPLLHLVSCASCYWSLSWQPQDLVLPRRYIIASYAGNNDLSLTNLC